MTKVWSRSESSGRALRRAASECLDQLGHSPEQVAARLEMYGVQGVPGRADDCPMARYLKAVIGSEPCVGRIGVLEQRLQINRRGLRLPFSVSLPVAVQAFVRDFDEGRFPVLVDAQLRGQGADAPTTLGDPASPPAQP